MGRRIRIFYLACILQVLHDKLADCTGQQTPRTSLLKRSFLEDAHLGISGDDKIDDSEDTPDDSAEGFSYFLDHLNDENRGIENLLHLKGALPFPSDLAARVKRTPTRRAPVADIPTLVLGQPALVTTRAMHHISPRKPIVEPNTFFFVENIFEKTERQSTSDIGILWIPETADFINKNPVIPRSWDFVGQWMRWWKTPDPRG